MTNGRDDCSPGRQSDSPGNGSSKQAATLPPAPTQDKCAICGLTFTEAHKRETAAQPVAWREACRRILVACVSVEDGEYGWHEAIDQIRDIAKQQYAAPPAGQEADLAMLVRRLVNALNIASPGHAIAKQAAEYLVKHDHISFLRSAAAPGKGEKP